MNSLFLPQGNAPTSASIEEENELIKRFLLTLESEIAENQLNISSITEYAEVLDSELPKICETFMQNVYVRENYINVLSSIISKR